MIKEIVRVRTLRVESEIGGAEGDRTPDLMNAIHALSQLSYGPVICFGQLGLYQRVQ